MFWGLEKRLVLKRLRILSIVGLVFKFLFSRNFVLIVIWNRFSAAVDAGRILPISEMSNFELRHPRCVGSITKNFCVLHMQSNTTIFHLVVQ